MRDRALLSKDVGNTSFPTNQPFFPVAGLAGCTTTCHVETPSPESESELETTSSPSRPPILYRRQLQVPPREVGRAVVWIQICETLQGTREGGYFCQTKTRESRAKGVIEGEAIVGQ